MGGLNRRAVSCSERNFLLCTRLQAEEEFLAAAAPHFTIETVPDEELDTVYQCADVDVLLLRPKAAQAGEEGRGNADDDAGALGALGAAPFLFQLVVAACRSQSPASIAVARCDWDVQRAPASQRRAKSLASLTLTRTLPAPPRSA